jgi:hypothetical protein
VVIGTRYFCNLIFFVKISYFTYFLEITKNATNNISSSCSGLSPRPFRTQSDFEFFHHQLILLLLLLNVRLWHGGKGGSGSVSCTISRSFCSPSRSSTLPSDPGSFSLSGSSESSSSSFGSVRRSYGSFFSFSFPSCSSLLLLASSPNLAPLALMELGSAEHLLPQNLFSWQGCPLSSC